MGILHSKILLLCTSLLVATSCYPAARGPAQHIETNDTDDRCFALAPGRGQSKDILATFDPDKVVLLMVDEQEQSIIKKVELLGSDFDETRTVTFLDMAWSPSGKYLAIITRSRQRYTYDQGLVIIFRVDPETAQLNLVSKIAQLVFDGQKTCCWLQDEDGLVFRRSKEPELFIPESDEIEKLSTQLLGKFDWGKIYRATRDTNEAYLLIDLDDHATHFYSITCYDEDVWASTHKALPESRDGFLFRRCSTRGSIEYLIFETLNGPNPFFDISIWIHNPRFHGWAHVMGRNHSLHPCGKPLMLYHNYNDSKVSILNLRTWSESKLSLFKGDVRFCA